MKEQTYRTMTDAVKSSPFLEKYIIWFNRLITTAVYLLYPGLLVLLYLRSRIAEPGGASGETVDRTAALSLGEGLIPAILIPAISFILLSIVRHMIDSPRPYEVIDFDPVINKKTKGHSFPSRHIFSIFLIATTVFYFYPIAGVLIGLTGSALALNRVLGGVHFVKDVVVGGLAGIFCGVVGFYIILPLING